jgi:hypothetical protein
VDEARWIFLIHQIPPKPSYFRVKIWRRLQRLGAVALKNSVYVLPASDRAREDFEWLLREIREGGGDATLCGAHLLDGLSDEELEAVFSEARDADYRSLAEEAQALARSIAAAAGGSAERPSDAATQLARLRRRLADIAAIDFFGAPGGALAEAALHEVEVRLRGPAPSSGTSGEPTTSVEGFAGRTWATRAGVHVDRIASAWLIRRFIDAGARIRFVPDRGYGPEPGEIRFDMFEAEFTHEGDRCTFEVLLERIGLADPALRPIAEIVHDLDLKDEKFGRSEAPGLDRMIDGVTAATEDDEERIARGAVLFDTLYRAFGGVRVFPPQPGEQK